MTDNTHNSTTDPELVDGYLEGAAGDDAVDGYLGGSAPESALREDAEEAVAGYLEPAEGDAAGEIAGNLEGGVSNEVAGNLEGRTDEVVGYLEPSAAQEDEVVGYLQPPENQGDAPIQGYLQPPETDRPIQGYLGKAPNEGYLDYAASVDQGTDYQEHDTGTYSETYADDGYGNTYDGSDSYAASYDGGQGYGDSYSGTDSYAGTYDGQEQAGGYGQSVAAEPGYDSYDGGQGYGDVEDPGNASYDSNTDTFESYGAGLGSYANTVAPSENLDEFDETLPQQLSQQDAEDIINRITQKSFDGAPETAAPKAVKPVVPTKASSTPIWVILGVAVAIGAVFILLVLPKLLAPDEEVGGGGGQKIVVKEKTEAEILEENFRRAVLVSEELAFGRDSAAPDTSAKPETEDEVENLEGPQKSGK